MAIYHWHMQAISRAQGRSATAAAAYRAGELIQDQRTGEIHDYTRRRGVWYAEVIMPDGSTASREQLWSSAELAEKRKDAKVAREIVIALPAELSQSEQIQLARDYAQGLAERTGWAVDVAVHGPHRQGDQRNVHAHVLCTTRHVEQGPDGQLHMGAKTRAWDQAKSSVELVKGEREQWEQQVNQALERAGQTQRVDRRSHAERQTGLVPQVHLGPKAAALEQRGQPSERGTLHREIAAHNAQILQLAHTQEQVRILQAERHAYRKAAQARQQQGKVNYVMSQPDEASRGTPAQQPPVEQTHIMRPERREELREAVAWKSEQAKMPASAQSQAKALWEVEMRVQVKTVMSQAQHLEQRIRTVQDRQYALLKLHRDTRPEPPSGLLHWLPSRQSQYEQSMADWAQRGQQLGARFHQLTQRARRVHEYTQPSVAGQRSKAEQLAERQLRRQRPDLAQQVDVERRQQVQAQRQEKVREQAQQREQARSQSRTPDGGLDPDQGRGRGRGR